MLRKTFSLYTFQGHRWCSRWAEVVRPHQAAMASGPLERRRLVKVAPIETDFRPVHATVKLHSRHYDLRRATLVHPPSTLGPAPLSVVSSSAENTSPAGPFVTLAFVRGSGLAC